MDAQSYINVAQSTANQPLGGKELKFPVNGISNKIESTHLGTAYTPSAINVILRSPYNGDFCGGTRPGLRAFVGNQPSQNNKYIWLWPNGEVINWPNGDRMVFSDLGHKVIMPDGSFVIDQHELFDVSASKGSIPSGCTSVAIYRSRAVVAKDSMWYASRTGAYDDFDYGDHYEDISRPVSGNVALSGKSGENITSLAAIADNTLVIATRRSLWRIVGEPTQQMSLIAENVGIISRNAWCYDGLRFWFMSAEGLYAMVFGEPPVKMTPHLEGDFTSWNSATLIYDVSRNGIHIIGTDKNNSATDWFFDISNSAAWKMLYPTTKRPSFGGLAMIDGRNRVVFYCSDGMFRYWDDDQITDDGTDIVSAVSLGPVTYTTGNTSNAFLAELDCELDTNITAVSGANVSGVVGKTSHDVITSTRTFIDWIKNGATETSSDEKFRYVQIPGWNRVKRPRVRCNSLSVSIWSSSNRWAVSKVTVVHRGCGRIRK